jgi:uncharacterized protein DUF6615
MSSGILCSTHSASCALSECGAFRAEGQYIADWMRAQTEVKEESITDSYLYRLAQSVPTVRYKSFSRWEEARRTGADWEWWFLLPKRSLRLRVQAKKLRPGKNCRGDLARTNKYGGQLAMLRKRARRDNAIPVYALYSSASVILTVCGRTSSFDGVFLIHANSVQALIGRQGKITDQHLIRLSRPTSCLPCCILTLSLAKDWVDVNSWLDAGNTMQSDLDGDKDIGWHDNNHLPEYVWALFGDGIAVHSENVRSKATSDVGAIIAVDLRDGKSTR